MIARLFALTAFAALWFNASADHALDEFPRLDGECDDTARLQRAVDATPSGVLRIPAGVYLVSSTVMVTNLCSLEMNKSAILRAVKEIPFVLHVDISIMRESLPPRDDRRRDYGLFLSGGRIDGNGLASCMALDGFHHFTMRDAAFLNGRRYGLLVNGKDLSCNELVADNLYFACFLRGLAGNTAVCVCGGDSHYTDCIAVDYTIGFHLKKGGSNRLTRCHVWGGHVPPPREGEPREMLKGSINYKVESSAAILRDCYADTGEVGFEIAAWDTRLLGCSYYSNKRFGLDDITIIRHKFGRLLVSDALFVKSAPHVKVYEGCGKVAWRDIIYSGFGPGDDCPGALVVDAGGQSKPPAASPLDLSK